MVAKATPFIIGPSILDLMACKGIILKQIATNAMVLCRFEPELVLTSSMMPCSVNSEKTVSMQKYPKIGTVAPISNPIKMLLLSLNIFIPLPNVLKFQLNYNQ